MAAPAGDAPSAFDHLSTIGTAFSFLFDGDLGLFLSTLLEGAPLVGVFLIVYILGRFVSGTTIFKKAESKTYENLFGLGLALVGIATPKVYGFIVSVLGGSFILILTIIFVIAAIIIQITRARGNAAEASAEAHEALAESRKVQKDSSKEKHDLKLQKKLEKRERGSISKAEGIIQDELNRIRNLKMILKNMVSLLQQVQGVRDEGAAKSYRDRLLKMAAKAAASIKSFVKKENTLRSLLSRMKNLEKTQFKVDQKEIKEENDLRHHLKEKLQNEGHHEDNIEKHLIKFDTEIRNLVQRLQNAEKEKMNLLSHEIYDDEKIRNFDHKLQELQKQLISQLENSDDSGANQTVSEMYNLVNQINNLEDDFKHVLRQVLDVEIMVESLNRKLSDLVNRMMKFEKKEEKEDKKEESLYEDFFNKLHDAEKLLSGGKRVTNLDDIAKRIDKSDLSDKEKGDLKGEIERLKKKFSEGIRPA
ncbi:MAG: hypothetical protein ACQESE_01860 [Nanobdellota archaeon]